MKYNPKVVSYGLSVLTATAALIGAAGPLQAQEKKPNILVIMGDDVGWFNIGAYHRGIMSGKTPNLYHLDAMSDPYWFDYPQDWIEKYGPRNLVHLWATDVDGTTRHACTSLLTSPRNTRHS